MTQKTVWMSRDARGSDTGDIYFWGDKPTGKAGQFYLYGKNGKEKNPLDEMESTCDPFVRFRRMFGVSLPKPGELVKVTLKSQAVEKLSTQDDVAKRLRSAKKLDRGLLDEAAAWVDSICDDDDD